MKSFQFTILALTIGLGVVPIWTQANIPPFGMSSEHPLPPQGNTSPQAIKESVSTNTQPAINPADDDDSFTSTSRPSKAESRSRSARQRNSRSLSTSDISRDAPHEYTVKKGDTLWAIAKRFLNSPWKWHALWQMNRNEIKNPHWIYPGDVITLEYDSQGRPFLRKGGHRYTNYNGKLSPYARVESIANEAIPTISPSEIAPFLTKPLVINPGDLDKTPRIVGSLDERVVLGQGDIVYVKNLPNTGEEDRIWQIYRPGRPLVVRGINQHGDPSERLLGYEAVHLGDAKVRRLSEGISSVEIIRAKQEIMRGDRLIPAPKTAPMNYIPRAPEAEIDAEIISLPEGVAETGRNNVVAISAGKYDGLDIGHVLSIHRKGRIVKLPDDPETDIKLPDERVGLLMVFRTFDHVSYGLVMGSERQIQLGDRLHQP